MPSLKPKTSLPAIGVSVIWAGALPPAAGATLITIPDVPGGVGRGYSVDWLAAVAVAVAAKGLGPCRVREWS
jgi:hypothetical protein